ncbi:MAG: hypothetical protein ACYDC9_08820 [Dermatophilaceae bacterium]
MWIVNVGGFVASLGTVALIGIVLDQVAPGGPSTYPVDSFRAAMSVQYIVWVLGVVQILRSGARPASRKDVTSRSRMPRCPRALTAGGIRSADARVRAPLDR